MAYFFLKKKFKQKNLYIYKIIGGKVRNLVPGPRGPGVVILRGVGHPPAHRYLRGSEGPSARVSEISLYAIPLGFASVDLFSHYTALRAGTLKKQSLVAQIPVNPKAKILK